MTASWPACARWAATAAPRRSDSSSWRSLGEGSARRGVKLSLLYMGTSKWRKVQPFTSQPDDVARTIVTLWTKAGNFSFLAADLDNGPILAPEYGFFVRRTGGLTPTVFQPPPEPRTPRNLLAEKMDSIAGSTKLLGWGSNDTPWFGGNPNAREVSVSGITIPARTLAMHPGGQDDVAVGWRSQVKGTVAVRARVEHAQHGGNGIQWRILHVSKAEPKTLAYGVTEGWGLRKIPSPAEAKELDAVTVEPGDMISLIVGRKGSHQCDSTLIDLVISEVGGRGRIWNLRDNVVGTLHAGNPHADARGQAGVWYFYKPSPPAPLLPSQPPIALASQAASAAEFIKELQARKLSTIRERTRVHAEQTWQGAVTAMRGNKLPPHPKPPAGSEPSMKVQVPCQRLTAQWNLGAWHLVRHCEKNPKNGRLWFSDYPYTILAAETYMILRVLDLMGSHQGGRRRIRPMGVAARRPRLPRSQRAVHGWARLPDARRGARRRHGCHPCVRSGFHRLGLDRALLDDRRHRVAQGLAPRIKANAQWMLRQRQVMAEAVPGGQRLWCKGLQPPLQVTPDSGGLWMQFYEAEAYYWASLARLAATLSVIDPEGGGKLAAEAEAYRQDLRAAVERSIALSPVVPVRDGTFHSVIPFACYVRGLGTGAWGWQRDGSGAHVGPLYWDTVQSAAALMSPAGLLSPSDVRVQGYLDVLEDRLLLENPYVDDRQLVRCRLAISGRAGTYREHAPGRRRHPGFSPLIPELLCHRHRAQRRLRLQRTRRPRPAGQDLRGGRLPRTLPQSAGHGRRPGPVAGAGHAAGMAGAGQEDSVQECADTLRPGGLRDRLGRGPRQDRRHGEDAVSQSRRRQCCCVCAIPRPRRSRASRSTAGRGPISTPPRR